MLCDRYRDFLRMTVYQIYPRSFMDSDGDGTGDLQGVISRLDYIQDLGADAVWLCPCFKSPNEDNGYDVSDYRDIMDEFGTMDDMDQLIAELHRRGMKLILDLVPNHTSTQHRWFQESRKGRDNPYSDYYYWFDDRPNDWKSDFGGSAWEYDEVRGQYYLHSFAVGQADLNWDNPAVVREMQDVIDFWAGRGADGFRIDVIDRVSKDLPGGKNGFGPGLHENIRAMFGREEVSHLFTVGEGEVLDTDELKRHCAADRKELTTLFLFDHMDCGRSDKFTPKKDGLGSLRDMLVRWQECCCDNDLLHSLFIENHDQPPMLSRIANDRELRYESATDIAAMVYLLKGIPFIYQGQEFGMAAAHYDDISCFDDVESLGAYREMLERYSPEEALEKVNFGSRDNARHPMAWDSSRNGGFTEGEPWLCLHSRSDEINLEKDLASERSVFRFYRDLLRLRRENEAFLDGELEVISKQDDSFFIYTRTLGYEKWAVICNFDNEQAIDLPFECEAPALANLGRETAGGKYKAYECSIAKVMMLP
ncbi:MAG: alpha-glucosidase [Clostridiales bacterium]|nr:alpha-glucosidase [Clostridiales bacterium]